MRQGDEVDRGTDGKEGAMSEGKRKMAIGNIFFLKRLQKEIKKLDVHTHTHTTHTHSVTKKSAIDATLYCTVLHCT